MQLFHLKPKMSNNICYSNFVKAVTPTTSTIQPYLTGEEARKLYLEEIKDAKNTQLGKRSIQEPQKRVLNIRENVSLKDLFLSAENNDVDTLRNILDSFPNLLNKVDDFGWSLLMIACQANSVEAAEELLNRGIDTTVRDKAGNSARSLVIRNKNLVLADLFLSHNKNTKTQITTKSEENILCDNKQSSKKSFVCDICNNTYPDREDHLSSTIHNISASKDKKIPTNYVIPRTNKGYQLMVKGGWDRETGLGRDGKGKKYPIKAVQKIDRKGLGHEKKVEHKEDITEKVKVKHKSSVHREKRHIRRFERNFRRQFY